MKNYKVVNGTSFDESTPDKVCQIIVKAKENRQRLQFHFGDTKTGIDWNEEFDTVGTIGRSTGNIKIPLLIKTKRSTGGVAILDRCIVKIKDAKTKKVLYQHEKYQQSKFAIVPSDLEGYSHNLEIDGKLDSRHKTERSAKILLNKLS